MDDNNKSIRTKILETYIKTWDGDEEEINFYNNKIYKKSKINELVTRNIPFPELSMHDEDSCDTLREINIMVNKTRLSDSFWQGSACRIVNPYLGLPFIKYLNSQREWYIADYGWHCFITNVDDNANFYFDKLDKIESTSDIDYQPLIIDFLNFPVGDGLLFFNKEDYINIKFTTSLELFDLEYAL